ncbi:ABC transporter ATP-binding protein [Alsobacter sp. R-9]
MIEAHGLSKYYRIGRSGGGGLGRFLSERMFASLPQQARRATTSTERIVGDVLKALDDVSFSVGPGEVLGVMGPNGAGKSTLLKVLCRITAPSDGSARIRGRVGALLEVGTGFNYELSGRENIYLNGLTLGMRRPEIDAKFDEIVAFSGVEEFLDTPVKRYSSGMVTRLGFAVAAHLEPEILIVDEILAVGDAAFQRRCINKMRDVARNEGRVVLFISHSVEAVLGVCTRAIRLEDGRLVQDGTTRDVIDGYLSTAAQQGGSLSLISRSDREGTGELQVVAATVEARLDATEPTTGTQSVVLVGQPASISVVLAPMHDRVRDVSVELWVKDLARSTVTVLANMPVGYALRAVTSPTRVEVTLPRCQLTPGHYWIDAVIRAEGRLVDQIAGIVDFSVVPAPYYADLVLQVPGGMVLVDQDWTSSEA